MSRRVELNPALSKVMANVEKEEQDRVGAYNPYSMPGQKANEMEQEGRWQFHGKGALPPPPPYKNLPKKYLSGGKGSWIDWETRERRLDPE